MAQPKKKHMIFILRGLGMEGGKRSLNKVNRDEEKKPDSSDDIGGMGWWYPAIAIAGVISLWALSGVILYQVDERGTYGDMFGAVNALFSGLAFAGVILAILLQKTELTLQRQELKLTREELGRQSSEMKTQNKTLHKQSFENTFFQLLSMQQEIISAINVRSNPPSTGRQSIKVLYKTLQKKWQEADKTPDVHGLDKVNNVFMSFYNANEHVLGHYLRNLYHILRLVDESEIDNKRLYTNLIRAQLSSYEILVLFYDGLSKLGSEKLKPLIEEYALLKHVNFKLLLDKKHKDLYKSSAF